MSEIEIYKAALNQWGPEAQTLMAFEEMSELQKELCKSARGKQNKAEIAEEIADVIIMLHQMSILHDCEGEVEEAKARKLERLEERLRAADKAKDAPATDVAPVKHGRWIIDSSDEYANHYHCDKCGKEIDLCNEIYVEPSPNYCPNCGAKMDKEAHDGD